jgi:hypothetical protein
MRETGPKYPTIESRLRVQIFVLTQSLQLYVQSLRPAHRLLAAGSDLTVLLDL